jgi:deoxyribonuclease-4
MFEMFSAPPPSPRLRWGRSAGGKYLEMKFGFHISIAGGLDKVPQRAKNLGCETIQIFSRNPRGWGSKSIAFDEAQAFREGIEKARISSVFIHMPYLPNLGSPDQELWEKSVDSLCSDLRTGELLDVAGVIMHPGNATKGTPGEAIERIARGINLAFERVPNQTVLLIENTAGQGTAVGHEFSQIKAIFDGVDDTERLRVCLDTAHAYEAGYDMATQKGLDKTIEEFDKLIGLQNLLVLHLNDSKTPLGSHVDRHWHIGEGCIGVDGFQRIVNLPAFSELPCIMETPRKSDEDDLKNMRTVRELCKTCSP